MSGPPSRIRVGHLTYEIREDDAAVAEHGVRNHGDFAAWSHAPTQTIALATKAVSNQMPLGLDYRRETLLHEVLHCCLRAADCDPDRDAKAGVEDVEERAVAAMAGPLLAALQDNPALLQWLTSATS
jgi:hypothetical protein